MIFLSLVKFRHLLHLGVNLSSSGSSETLQIFLRLLLLIVVRVEDDTPVLSAPRRRWAVHLPKLNEKVLKGHHRSVEFNQNAFCKVLHLSVRWIVLVTTSVPHNTSVHSLHGEEPRLRAPESAASYDEHLAVGRRRFGGYGRAGGAAVLQEIHVDCSRFLVSLLLGCVLKGSCQS